jgi:hypothetical protein
VREPAGKCAACGLSGFAEASMSITEAGNTCPHCYLKWEQSQRQQMLAAERDANLAVHRSFRWRMIAAAFFVLIIVIAANWKSCGR